MSMSLRLAKELPRLCTKTLAHDGLAVEDAEQVSSIPQPASCQAGRRGGGATPGVARAFVVLLAGPRGSPFEGGVFRLQVEVPSAYPMEPPSIRFRTKLFHPNVGHGYTPGAICLDILRKEAWSPALTLEHTLLSIASLLADPNPASPMDSEAAKLYEGDRAAYNKRVRELVRKHAQPAGDGQEAAWAGSLGKGDDAAAEGAQQGDSEAVAAQARRPLETGAPVVNAASGSPADEDEFR